MENNQNLKTRLHNVFRFKNKTNAYWVAVVSFNNKVQFKKYYSYTKEGREQALKEVAEFKANNIPFSREALAHRELSPKV